MTDGTTWQPVVLALDASTYQGSVAVLRGGAVLAERAVAMRGADEERLMPAVAEALDAAGVAPATLDAICCGGGPGSFTSLRIAGAIAKGLASASGAPLVALPSLALVALAAGGRGRVLATMDAMRGDRYAARVTIAPDGGAVTGYEFLGVVPGAEVAALAARHAAPATCDAGDHPPRAAGAAAFGLALGPARRWTPRADALVLAPVPLAPWEPDYGRKAEAQVKWEATHGRALPPDPAEPLVGLEGAAP